jgi:hypothetical protein
MMYASLICMNLEGDDICCMILLICLMGVCMVYEFGKDLDRQWCMN